MLYTLPLSIVLLLVPAGIEGGNEAVRLHTKLLKNYNTMTRPVVNESDSINVTLGLAFQQIIDVDEKNQVIETNVWLTFKWTDQLLQWDPDDYSGIKEIRMRPDQIWIPDVLLYNSVDDNFNSVYQANLIVRFNGTIEWLPPAIVKSYCKINIMYFPFDEQQCDLKFGSWTYGGGFITLLLGGIDKSTYTENGEWVLVDVKGKRNEFFYDCCPDPYYDVTFTIMIQRRTLYYGFNLIVPCVLIAIMALLDFILPPDSCEKLTLGITIFMSLCFFLLMVANALPATSEAIPLLGVYFCAVLIIVSASQVFTILVLNFHYRTPDFYEMPPLVRKIFLNWLPWLLMMKRPGYTFERGHLIAIEDADSTNFTSDSKDVTLDSVINAASDPLLSKGYDRPKSVLSNILDLDDADLRRIRWFQPLEPTQLLPSCNGMASSGPKTPQAIGSSSQITPNPRHEMHRFLYEGLSSFEFLLSSMMVDLKLITKKLKEEDKDDQEINDWQFAAMVLDRLCLIVFVIIFVLATGCIMLSPPNLI